MNYSKFLAQHFYLHFYLHFSLIITTASSSVFTFGNEKMISGINKISLSSDENRLIKHQLVV